MVTEAIRFLTSVVEAGHIRRRALLAISGRLVAKLQQGTPNAVLCAAAEFMAAASRSVPACCLVWLISRWIEFSCSGQDVDHPVDKSLSQAEKCSPGGRALL